MECREIENLKKRVSDLERNVGSAMGELGLTTITTREASDNYCKGINTPLEMIYSEIAEPTSVDMLKGEIRELQMRNQILECENKDLRKMFEHLITMKS